MPRRDGTGPMGEGSLSGRGLGQCKDQGDENKAYGLNSGRGRCSSRGLGRGRGQRNRFCASVDTQESLARERQILMRRIEVLDNLIDNEDVKES